MPCFRSMLDYSEAELSLILLRTHEPLPPSPFERPRDATEGPSTDIQHDTPSPSKERLAKKDGMLCGPAKHPTFVSSFGSAGVRKSSRLKAGRTYRRRHMEIRKGTTVGEIREWVSSAQGVLVMFRDVDSDVVARLMRNFPFRNT